MPADITYVGQEYWKVVSRFHRHRANKNIKPLVIFELRNLVSNSQAVRMRVQSFLSTHRDAPPSNTPFGGGGSVA